MITQAAENAHGIGGTLLEVAQNLHVHADFRNFFWNNNVVIFALDLTDIRIWSYWNPCLVTRKQISEKRRKLETLINTISTRKYLELIW